MGGGGGGRRDEEVPKKGFTEVPPERPNLINCSINHFDIDTSQSHSNLSPTKVQMYSILVVRAKRNCLRCAW